MFIYIWKINPFTNKVKKGKSYDYMILFIWLEQIQIQNIQGQQKLINGTLFLLQSRRLT